MLALIRVLLVALLIQPMGGFSMPVHATGTPAFGWSAQDFCHDGMAGKAPMGDTQCHDCCHHCCCPSAHGQGLASNGPAPVSPQAPFAVKPPSAAGYLPADGTGPAPYDATGPPA